MSSHLKYAALAVVALFALSLVVCSSVAVPALAAGTTYYVDCSAATNGDGSQSSPWNNLATVNGTTFSAGDSILLQRGTTCTGQLWPKGSGADGSPITLGAYGTGALPIVDGSGNEAAVQLVNQSYWHVEDLEITGSTKFGVLVTAAKNDPTTTHIRLTDLVVHDVWGEPYTNKRSGLVSFLNGDGTHIFDDVIVDNVTAYSTNQWAGIEIWGGPWPINVSDPVFSNNVIFRNSTVYDIYADGIIIFETYNGLIENCVSYDTGIEPTETVGTPNGIWTWGCWGCTLQYNECYRASSPGFDGGCYDIDYYCEDNTYQYNYAHDADGYCVSVFGAAEFGTKNSIVRYNVCSNNVRDVRWVERQGDVCMMTWGDGWLDGVAIYNNTIYYNPPLDYAALNNTADFGGNGANYFKNNIIFSEVPSILKSVTLMDLDYNLYWYTGTETPKFWYGGSKLNPTLYTGFSAYQAGSGQDAHGIYADPKLNAVTYHGEGMPGTAFTLQDDSPAIDAGTDVGSMGARDFFGNAIPYDGVYDIGAHEWSGSVPTPTPTATSTPGPSATPTFTPVPTSTPTPLPTTTPGGPAVMHVEDMYTTDKNNNPKSVFQKGDVVYWWVQIRDQYGASIEGALVTCDVFWPSGRYWATDDGTTDATGWTRLQKKTQSPNPVGLYTIKVTDVAKEGTPYYEGDNVVSSVTFTLQ